MKRKNNLYNQIIDIQKIQKVYDHRVRINTKNKKKLEKFDNYYVSNMIYIKTLLERREYVPGRYNVFLIKEPKLRLIMSQNIIDKIINHVVSEYFMINVFDKSLIDQNIATRKGRGTHYGIQLLKKYLNEVKNKPFYVLKFDISKYFFNLDHDIIKKLVRTKIKDKEVINIFDLIIDSTNEEYVNKTIQKVKQHEINKILNSKAQDKEKLIEEINSLPEYKKGKGLPIGNMSSQVFAITYLNELDHYIKEKLKIKYYIRYMDDGILIHEDKKYLEYCLQEIEKILDKYKLELNKKTRIYNHKEPFEFLGFKYMIKNNKVIMKVKNQTKKRFKRKIKKLNSLVEQNVIPYEKFLQVKGSYLGHLSYGHTKKLVANTLNKYEKKYDLIGSEVMIIDKKIIYKT